MALADQFTLPGKDELWSAVTAAAPFYVAVFSLDGVLRYLNRTLGPEPPAYFVGRSLSELFPGNEQVAAAFQDVIARRHVADLQVPGVFPLGPQTIAARLVPIVEDDRVTAVLGVSYDVTESRQTNIELRMSVNALHRLLEEREQMASDLHDGILQSLYGVGLRLEAARGAIRRTADLRQHLDRGIEQLKDTMSEVRRFIGVGRSSLAVANPWESTLAGVLKSLAVEQGATLDLELPSAIASRVPVADRSDVVFIAREAVSNAVRHAKATRISVRLSEAEDRVRLAIADDGSGFDRESTAAGVGLLTMSRRADRMAAILAVQSSPGGGTVVNLDMSVPTGSR